MKTIALALGGLAAAWVAAPAVAMAVRGTIDQRTLARWREVTPVPAPDAGVPIPEPRRGDVDDRVRA